MSAQLPDRRSWKRELAPYLKLPRVLAWAVGNANYHHVHHLSAKIPNYRLRLTLWDEDRGCLVRFPVPA